jgi:hypothetical protein
VDDVILYHLAIDAGTPPDDPSELAYAYERQLKVLPSFAVIPAQASLVWLTQAPGFDVPRKKLLHVEQDLEILRPLAAEGDARTDARVTNVSTRVPASRRSPCSRRLPQTATATRWS